MKKEILAHPHLGEIIKAYIENHRYPKAAIARNAGISSQTLNNTLKSANMTVHNLWTYCFALNYNLFQEIALLLPETLKQKEISNNLDTASEEIRLLQKRIEILEAENALLLKLVSKS